MKYFTFLVSILTLFFVFFFVYQETFAQVQPDNTSKSLDINQISKRLNELEESIEELKANKKNEFVSRLNELEKSIEELKANKKDRWDKFEIVGTLLTPITIAVLGYILKKSENQREKQRLAFEQNITQINARVRQAELLSKFIEPLLSDDTRKRTLGVEAILLALPKEGKVLLKAISECDPLAQESLETFLRLENLVKNQYELEHLYRLYEGEKQPRKIDFKKRKSFQAELRHLRDLGLIENKPDKTIGGMPQSGDLRDYVKLTQDGINHIENREKYGLANPRRGKNSEFWSSYQIRLNNLTKNS